jgi:hypothetical protein
LGKSQRFRLWKSDLCGCGSGDSFFILHHICMVDFQYILLVS